MKRFKYSLDTVLDYKTQVLDELRSEHAVIARNVMTKQEQIVRLKEKLNGFRRDLTRQNPRALPLRTSVFTTCVLAGWKKSSARKRKSCLF